MKMYGGGGIILVLYWYNTSIILVSHTGLSVVQRSNRRPADSVCGPYPRGRWDRAVGGHRRALLHLPGPGVHAAAVAPVTIKARFRLRQVFVCSLDKHVQQINTCMYADHVWAAFLLRTTYLIDHSLAVQ
jgi:hypothetical protein